MVTTVAFNHDELQNQSVPLFPHLFYGLSMLPPLRCEAVLTPLTCLLALLIAFGHPWLLWYYGAPSISSIDPAPPLLLCATTPLWPILYCLIVLSSNVPRAMPSPCVLGMCVCVHARVCSLLTWVMSGDPLAGAWRPPHSYWLDLRFHTVAASRDSVIYCLSSVSDLSCTHARTHIHTHTCTCIHSVTYEARM